MKTLINKPSSSIRMLLESGLLHLQERVASSHSGIFHTKKYITSLQNPSEMITNQCYFYELNSENPTNVWNSSSSLYKARLDVGLATFKDEVILYG